MARASNRAPADGRVPGGFDLTNPSWRNYLRIGLILGVTGIIVLIHSSITSTGRLPHNVEIIIGIVLVVVGLPLVVMGVVRRRQSYGV